MHIFLLTTNHNMKNYKVFLILVEQFVVLDIFSIHNILLPLSHKYRDFGDYMSFME